MYHAKYLLDESSPKTVYFSYIHSYLNYANIIAWAGTYQTKLKTIYYHQKHAPQIVFNQAKLTHSRSFLQWLNTLNIYQINLYQHLNFMPKVSNIEAPLIFNMFTKASHKYPTNFTHIFSLKKCSLNSTKYCISFRRPKLWNESWNTNKKQITSNNLFSRKVRWKPLNTENKVRYF